MRAHRFLPMLSVRLLLVGAVLLPTQLMTAHSAMAHGDGISEISPAHASQSISPNPASPKAAGLQAACWALSMPYGAMKVAYAIGGGVVGGLAWTVTGGNTELAKSIWVSSMTGDYIVQPQHLSGEKRLYFVGPPE